jgi:hypothetical protein
MGFWGVFTYKNGVFGCFYEKMGVFTYKNGDFEVFLHIKMAF